MRRLFKEKKLGKAEGGRRYDLPLNKSAGTGFLVLLIGLMTFLAVMALAASFTLSAMKTRWSSGLQNRATVELPAQTVDGKLLSHDDIAAGIEKLDGVVKAYPGVKATHVLSDDEIQELVKPWLGENLTLLDKVPLPGLISVEMNESTPDTVTGLRRAITDAMPEAKLDTHESWLQDLLRFTGALQFAAAILTFVIGITAVTAIAGAVKSRLAVHSADVELLHLMGASDSYIARQFQRHSMRLALRGALMGMVAGSLVILGIGWASGQMGVNLLPDFTLSPQQMTAILCLPAIAATLAIFAARHTVMTTLSRMP
jgi:cell division transport system permease protein